MISHKPFFTVAAIFMALLGLQPCLHGNTTSLSLWPLPDVTIEGVQHARDNTLTVSLDPIGPDLQGKPGDTIGWSFEISWRSNARDIIVFGKSHLTPGVEEIASGGYIDLIGDLGGNVDGRVLVDTDWVSPEPFSPQTNGLGYITIDPGARPGTQYAGLLNLPFMLYGYNNGPVLMNTYTLSIPVSITVVAGDPVAQTITFQDIPDKVVTDAPFAVVVETSSGLPATVFSLTPDLCTVVDGMATLHAAGRCELIAFQPGDDTYLGTEPVYQSFEITKIPASVEIQGQLEQTYDGTDKLFTAVTTPESLPVKWLYNGEETPPRAPGIYILDALVEDPVHEGKAQARLLITDSSPVSLQAYADWLLEHFTSQQIQDGLVTAQTADLAADGTPNLLKYALGLDPWTTMSPEARSALPRFAGTGGTNALVFSLPTTPSGDLVIKVEASSDLATWTEIARRTRGGPWTGAASVFTGTPDETGLRADTLVTEPPLPAHPRRFYRLNIEFAP